MTTREKIAFNLRSLRAGYGLRQADVAKHLGLKRPAISEIEAGRRETRIDELVKLGELFEVPCLTLLDDPFAEDR